MKSLKFVIYKTGICIVIIKYIYIKDYLILMAEEPIFLKLKNLEFQIGK